MTDTVTLVSYNVLAAAYADPEYYAYDQRHLLDSAHRYPKVVQRVLGLEADMFCLQEVDHELYQMLSTALLQRGYRGRWAHKGKGKPDGCAIFSKLRVPLLTTSILEYDDRGEPTGSIALLQTFAVDQRPLIIVNTHLRWQPDTYGVNGLGYAQAEELVDSLQLWNFGAVICGDCNAGPQSAVMEVLRNAGFHDAHNAETVTFVPSNEPDASQKLDHVLGNARVELTPLEGVSMHSVGSVYPSVYEPSDHLPIGARIRQCIR